MGEDDRGEKVTWEKAIRERGMIGVMYPLKTNRKEKEKEGGK